MTEKLQPENSDNNPNQQQKTYTRKDLRRATKQWLGIGLTTGAALGVGGLALWQSIQDYFTEFSLSDNNWQSPQDGDVVDKVNLASRSIVSPQSIRAGWRHVSTDYTAPYPELPKTPPMVGDPYQGSEGILIRRVPSEDGITIATADLLKLGGTPGKQVHIGYNVHGERERAGKIQRQSINGQTGRRIVTISRGGGN